jgi:hypothetical protein
MSLIPYSIYEVITGKMWSYWNKTPNYILPKMNRWKRLEMTDTLSKTKGLLLTGTDNIVVMGNSFLFQIIQARK